MPRIRQRSLPAKASVWDGDTLVVGGAQPALTAGQKETRLLVLVTPTIIDPAGNRVHTHAEVDRARGGQRALGFDWYLGNVLMNQGKDADSGKPAKPR